jgi:hypothetical protein
MLGCNGSTDNYQTTPPQPAENIGSILSENDKLLSEISAQASAIANTLGGSIPSNKEVAGKSPVNDVRTVLAEQRYRLRSILDDLTRASRAVNG